MKFNIFKKKDHTNTGIKYIEKIKVQDKTFYKYDNGVHVIHMNNLDFLLKSLSNQHLEIRITDEDLFNESVLESRRNRYQFQCDMMGVVNDKDPDSFYDLYSEWPVPDGKWTIIKFDGSERFSVRRKDKKSILELVDDLNSKTVSKW